MWVLMILVSLQDGCGQCEESKPASESKLAPTAASELVDYGFALKSAGRDEMLLEAFQKRFGASATIEGTRVTVKIPAKGRILLSDLLSAAEEGKVELDESSISARGMTVWFEDKSIAEDYPELNLAEAEDGSLCLSFGAKTSVTLADLRKIGTVKQAEIRTARKAGCCGSAEKKGCCEK